MARSNGAALAMSLALGLATATCPAAAEGPADRSAAARQAITDYARLLMVESRADAAFGKYFAPGLIQHNPLIGDGHKGDAEFLEMRRKAEPDKYDALEKYVPVVHTIMADGNLVALMSHVFTNPADKGRVFVDIWRFEGGQFVEHWDVIQPIEEAVPNPAPVGCGVGTTYAAAVAARDTVAHPACSAPDRKADGEVSRKLVMTYLDMGQQPGRLVEAVETFVSPALVQHSRRIPPGRQGLIDYMSARAAARSADQRTSYMARVLADGDLVLVHRRVTSRSDPRGTAYADLFRVRDGKVVEHWDVVQPIPEFSVSGRSMVDGLLEPGRHKGGPQSH